MQNVVRGKVRKNHAAHHARLVDAPTQQTHRANVVHIQFRSRWRFGERVQTRFRDRTCQHVFVAVLLRSDNGEKRRGHCVHVAHVRDLDGGEIFHENNIPHIPSSALFATSYAFS